MAQFTKRQDATGNGLSNIKDTFAESLQLQNISSAPKQSKSLRLVSQVHMMAEQNVCVFTG